MLQLNFSKGNLYYLDVGRLDDFLNNLDVQEKPGRPCFHIFKNLDVQLFKTTKTWTSIFFVQGFVVYVQCLQLLRRSKIERSIFVFVFVLVRESHSH